MPLQPQVIAHTHMVVAGHYLAAQAGFEILEAGGNAIDAGIAAGLALGVVHSDQVSIAGVAPMIIHMPSRDVLVSIAGLGPWPAAADPAVFRERHGGVVPPGILCAVVPAAPDAWIKALRLYGTMSFAEVARAAIRYAAEGFTVHPVMHDFIARYQDRYRLWPQNAAIYLPDDAVPEVGQRFVQRDLAASLQYMADEEAAAGHRGREAGLAAARDAFYRGDIAARIAAFHAENGGWLTREDLAAYDSPVEPPLSRRFGDRTVHACGPWCQGPTLLQMLAVLEGSGFERLAHNSAESLHLVAESIKLAFADRERFYTDPAFADVPMARLLSDAYAAERRALIDPAQAFPGLPPAGDGGVADAADRRADAGPKGELPPAADTSYCCAVDRDGNVFSATPSDVSFDSPIVPGLGFPPSARGSQSRVTAGHPACLAPGKRPRLTPNPALALDGKGWVMPFGAPGGDAQPQGMLQVLLNHLVHGMEIQEAIEAPRIATFSQPDSFSPHEAHPGRLDAEGRIPEAVTDGLAKRGHDVRRGADFARNVAGVCAISADLRRGRIAGGADPRRSGRAVGW